MASSLIHLFWLFRNGSVAGCKENQFSGLPFWEAVTTMYDVLA